jgi:hypothetical protein
MTQVTNATIARSIIKLDSTLRGSIALSVGMKLAGRVFGLVEKYNNLLAGEVKYGRPKINPETGRNVSEELLIRIEEECSYYGATMQQFSEQCYIMLNNGGIMGMDPKVYAMNRAVPFVQEMPTEKLEVIAKAGRTTIAQVQQNQFKVAQMRAELFSKKAPSILADVEAFLAMAPEADFEEIPANVVDLADVCETCVKKYRASVAAGKKYDVADMLLFNEDCDMLKTLGLDC